MNTEAMEPVEMKTSPQDNLNAKLTNENAELRRQISQMQDRLAKTQEIQHRLLCQIYGLN